MAFSFSVHNVSGSSTFTSTIFSFKEAMVAAGWRVMGSGNTVIFENSGQGTAGAGTGSGGAYDVWANSSNVVYQANGAASWIRFRHPTAGSPEFVLSLDSSTGSAKNHFWRLERAYASEFTSGATADLPPIASLMLAPGQTIPGATTRGSNVTGKAIHPSGAGQTFWVIGDADENYDWLFWTMRDAATVFSMLGITKITALQTQFADPDPYAYWCGFRSADSATADWVTLTGGGPLIPANSTGLTQESFTAGTPGFNAEGGLYASIGLLLGGAWEGTYPIGLMTPTMDTIGGGFKTSPQSGALPLFSTTYAVPYSSSTLKSFVKGTGGNIVKMAPLAFIASNAVSAEVFSNSEGTERKLFIFKLALPWPTTSNFVPF